MGADGTFRPAGRARREQDRDRIVLVDVVGRQLDVEGLVPQLIGEIALDHGHGHIDRVPGNALRALLVDDQHLGFGQLDAVDDLVAQNVRTHSRLFAPSTPTRSPLPTPKRVRSPCATAATARRCSR